MGVDISGYVGPFALCKNPHVPKELKIRTCINTHCQRHKQRYWGKNVKFCSTCGSLIDEVTIVEKQPVVSTSELMEEIAGRMCPASMEYGFSELGEDVDIWINNLGTVNVGDVIFDPSSQCFAFVPELDVIDKTIQAFEEKCGEGLAKIRERYGVENVELKWGVLSWLC